MLQIKVAPPPKSFSKAGRAPHAHIGGLQFASAAGGGSSARPSTAPAGTSIPTSAHSPRGAAGGSMSSRGPHVAPTVVNTEADVVLGQVGEKVWLNSHFIAAALQVVEHDEQRGNAAVESATPPHRPGHESSVMSDSDAERARRLTSSPRLYDRRVLKQVARDHVRGQVGRFVQALGYTPAAAEDTPAPKGTINAPPSSAFPPPAAAAAAATSAEGQNDDAAEAPQRHNAASKQRKASWDRPPPCSTFHSEKAMPTASLMSTSPRFHQEPPRAPAVGHYHPKFDVVAHRPPVTLFDQADIIAEKRAQEHALLMASTAGAVSRRSPDHAPGDGGGSGDPALMSDGNNSDGKKHGSVAGGDATAAALSARGTTSAFKSQVPRLLPPPAFGSSATRFYGIYNGLAVSSSPRCFVELSRAVGRQQHKTGREPPRTAAADTVYDYDVDVLSARGSGKGAFVDIERRGGKTQRRLPATARSGVLAAAFSGDTHWSDRVEYEPAFDPIREGKKRRPATSSQKDHAAAVDFAKQVPRKPFFRIAPYSPQDHLDGVPQAVTRHVPDINFAAMRADRPTNKPSDCAVDTYDVRDEVTSPKLRGGVQWNAQVNPRSPRRGRDGGAAVAEASRDHVEVPISAYDHVRPKTVYNINFDGFTAHHPPQASAGMGHGVTAIDVDKVDSPLRRARTQGNPFIGQHTSRDKRESRFAPVPPEPLSLEQVAERYGVNTAQRIKEQLQTEGDVRILRDGNLMRPDHPVADFGKTCSRETALGARTAVELPAHDAPGPGSYNV